MTKKIFSQITLSVIATLTLTGTAFAAGWQQNATGWWYATNDANTAWHANSWQWLDGNGDGIAECYYFDGNGYALTNTTTLDGYQVNSDGAWTVNGAVQTKDAATGNTSETGSASTSTSTSPVTDGKSITKITINPEIDRLCSEIWQDGYGTVSSFDELIPEKTFATQIGSRKYYATNHFGPTAYFIDNSSFITGPARAFFNNIPEQGITVKAFYDNFGYPGISSQSRNKGVFSVRADYFLPIESFSVDPFTLETLVNNALIYIVATKGEDGTFYIYPDNTTSVCANYKHPNLSFRVD